MFQGTATGSVKPNPDVSYQLCAHAIRFVGGASFALALGEPHGVCARGVRWCMPSFSTRFCGTCAARKVRPAAVLGEGTGAARCSRGLRPALSGCSSCRRRCSPLPSLAGPPLVFRVVLRLERTTPPRLTTGSQGMFTCEWSRLVGRPRGAYPAQRTQ